MYQVLFWEMLSAKFSVLVSKLHAKERRRKKRGFNYNLCFTFVWLTVTKQNKCVRYEKLYSTMERCISIKGKEYMIKCAAHKKYSS